MSDIKKIKDEYLVKINNNHNLDNLNQIKSELFGKNGIIALEFKKIGSISANEKILPFWVFTELPTAIYFRIFHCTAYTIK